MPLQDSFGKKGGKDAQKPARARSLSYTPAIVDLMAAMRTAQQTIRQPVILTWKREKSGPVYVLTVIRNSENLEPSWILHADEKDNMTFLWSHSTTDTELIHNLISEQLAESVSAPAAVIPESLKKPAKGTEEDASSQPQFFENYKIIDTIGHGGMGIIYKANDRADGSFVALKVLRADLMVDPSNVERFKQEAAAVRSLRHPNLIALREFGVSRFGQPFLAMDYIEGVELRDVLKRSGHLSTPQFINVFTQICQALAYAHEQGLVHRDLKPGNIMLVKPEGAQESVKIIDFGIAKSMHENTGTSSITTFGHFLGSPAYMSPEQCGGAVLDARSDIYSLGCVMYEALTGTLPFHHDNILKIIFAQLNDSAAPFSVVSPGLDVPIALEEIIFKCLQKSPDDRYQSARELCEELWEFAAGGKAIRAQLSASQQMNEIKLGAPDGTVAVHPQAAASVDRIPVYQRDPIATSSVQYARSRPVSETALHLLLCAGVLNDNLMRVVLNCVQELNKGDLTIEQAAAIIRHATGKNRTK
jgi:serine/threonine protein kinase